MYCTRVVLAIGLVGWAIPVNPLAQANGLIAVQADKPGHTISPMLWGIFFQDMNLSADGGLHAEMIRNRSFEDSDNPEHWTLIERGGGKGRMSISLEKPAAVDPWHTCNRRSLCLRITEAGTRTPVMVANEGYGGIAVKAGGSYDLSFTARGGNGFGGPLTLALEGRDGKVIALHTAPDIGPEWTPFKVEFHANVTDQGARLIFSVTSRGTLWLDEVSLFPRKTWKNRPNGLRPDLAQRIENLEPSFVHFPGGWVQGDTLPEGYRWKETIGDIWERSTQRNTGQYWATHGLGYHEYLQLCEDLGAEPVFVINGGMSRRENVPMDQMGPVVQDALDAIEYANGPATTFWGALRASQGHPMPFRLRFIEIANENGGPAYQERYALFYDAIKARTPQMILIAGCPTDQRPADILEEHLHDSSEFFIQQAHRYVRYDRHGPKIYVGGYGITPEGGRGHLRGAIAEAVFMIGMERNSDVVVMASYAPLLGNTNHRPGNLGLINFDSARVFCIPSYAVQQMFSVNRGDVVLPIEVNSPSIEPGPRRGASGTQAELKDLKVGRDADVPVMKSLYAGATRQTPTGQIILKVVNVSNEAQPTRIHLNGVSRVEGPAVATVLTSGKPTDENTLDDPTRVWPETQTVALSGPSFLHRFPANSVTVMRIKAE